MGLLAINNGGVVAFKWNIKTTFTGVETVGGGDRRSYERSYLLMDEARSKRSVITDGIDRAGIGCPLPVRKTG